jgi:hypothetical protein
MVDDQEEKLVKVLEEIRDLLKHRNEIIVQKSEEAVQRRRELQTKLIAQRRRFLWILAPLLLLAIIWVTFVFAWALPRSEEKQAERQMEEYRMMQSNYLSQPK